MKRLFVIVILFFLIGCNTEETNQNVSSNEKNVTSDVVVKFGGIDIVSKRDVIEVSGEVQTTEDHFYYIFEYGEEVIIEETIIELDDDKGNWHTFELEINIKDKNLTNEELPLLTFYGKDDQQIINPNYVPVQIWFY